MIHNNSSDPVLIKKISLKIWSLRDEIEARIQSDIEATPEAGKTNIDLKKIRNEYSPKKNRSSDNILPMKSAAELDTGEDEMARAMAGEAIEEVPTEAENVVAINTDADGTANVISINVEAPTLAEEKISRGKTILSEINMDRMFFFSNKGFTEGQSIVIQFCIPKTFIANADVLYCRPFNLKSRIISQNNYTHRVLIRFNFLKEGERALLRQFIQSVEPSLLTKGEKNAEAPKVEKSSDFNELDDLGL